MRAAAAFPLKDSLTARVEAGRRDVFAERGGATGSGIGVATGQEALEYLRFYGAGHQVGRIEFLSVPSNALIE